MKPAHPSARGGRLPCPSPIRQPRSAQTHRGSLFWGLHGCAEGFVAAGSSGVFSGDGMEGGLAHARAPALPPPLCTGCWWLPERWGEVGCKAVLGGSVHGPCRAACGPYAAQPPQGARLLVLPRVALQEQGGSTRKGPPRKSIRTGSLIST